MVFVSCFLGESTSVAVQSFPRTLVCRVTCNAYKCGGTDNLWKCIMSVRLEFSGQPCSHRLPLPYSYSAARARKVKIYTESEKEKTTGLVKIKGRFWSNKAEEKSSNQSLKVIQSGGNQGEINVASYTGTSQ